MNVLSPVRYYKGLEAGRGNELGSSTFLDDEKNSRPLISLQKANKLIKSIVSVCSKWMLFVVTITKLVDKIITLNIYINDT